MNKFNKGKLIGVVTASLAAVSLMGVGFASWMINDFKDITTGNIKVEVGGIVDNRIIVELETQSVTGILKFDACQDDQRAITSSTNNESLSFSVHYKVKVGKQLSNFKVNATWTPGTSMSTAITNSYIASPWGSNNFLEVAGIDEKGTAGSTNSSSHVTTTGFRTEKPTSDTTDATFNIYSCTTTFYFGWGTAVGSMNPVYYDNTDENTNASLTALKALQSVNNETFTITLTPALAN